MTVASTSALKCESNTFDDLVSASAACNHKVPLSPAASMMSTAPNTPEAQANIKDKKLLPQLPAEIQIAEFSDSDDEEGLPGYPAWGSSWSMRSMRTPDSKPASSPMFSGSQPASFHLSDDNKVSEDDEQ
eukprot:gnl/MRDRNA2_/MRDRNA2_230722_c0_seq1.p1 gnl/MRDRNA2_/MRDRNA2_230722_c0~~gnl/MRDRNA2_/MRDRNA2_230722_c0_seq1.p1  ORF type:complete len:130 (-),score=35.57 gnl/MRDRNA2_/MRDRNA2_230722_c0_seq1:543-932(-)